MWGRRPDIHYVLTFGALAFVHTKVVPSRHKFADNCRIGFELGYRDGTLGCKVYFPSEGTVQVAGHVTVNEQILYKDRHHNDFDRRVRDWAIEQNLDLTSAGRRDYVLPVVEGSGDGDAVDNGSPQPTARRNTPKASNGGPSWLQRQLSTFSDEFILHLVLTRSNQASKDCSPIIGSFGEDEIAPDEDTSQNTVDSSDDEVSAFEDPDDEYHPAELMARQLLDDDAISLSTGEKNGRGDKKQKDRRSAPVEMVDPESEVDEVEELQVYVALAAITLITEPKRQPQQRTWHISEVKIPRSVSQAINSPQRAESWKGMEKEITTMLDNDVLELVPESEMPEGTKALQTMWRFQAKTDDFGNVLRYRPRLCVRGDKEKPGVDFNVVDTFSPRALAFVRSISGFPLKRGWVYKVNNALYGLHESGREWYDELLGWPSSKGLQRSLTEPCSYYFFDKDTTALVLVYVDDIICATIKESWKTQLFADLQAKYGIKDLGRLSNYLGVQVDCQHHGVLLHQAKYAKKSPRTARFC
ncbi:hypothetical protein PC120_g22221 [Phytophthora cactorum]|nr:hypothetical protein PC120_g22221 [Phytophthora cactorum]